MVTAVWAAAKEGVGSSFMWSAKVGRTKAEQEGSRGAGSSSVPLDRRGEGGDPQQAVLLVPISETAPAGECVQHLVGAWLQAILRKYAL